MKVGLGSAGVEIIRNNHQKGQTKNQLMLSEKGSEVSCIFFFLFQIFVSLPTPPNVCRKKSLSLPIALQR